ncbi:RDD family protein [Flavobacterium sp. RHBU_3]|uniref:RDD family protein n=1 Tax=Flavobacterium sp. RHBU_3 TaxID=3391184 RepID=UPI00398527B6
MASYFMVDSEIMVAPGKRFLNFLLDIIFYYIIIFIIGFIAAFFTYLGIYKPYEILSDEGPLGTMARVSVFLLYYFVFEALTGRTVAKFITGTIVVNEFGEKLSVTQVLGRTFSRLIPFDAFSFFGTPSRGWHDSIPNTYVVDAQKLKDIKMLRNDFEQIGQEQL